MSLRTDFLLSVVTKRITHTAIHKRISFKPLAGVAYSSASYSARLPRSNAAVEKLVGLDAPGIHDYYPSLVEELKTKRHTESSALRSPSQVSSVLESLAISGRPEDMQRIEEMLSDLSPVFGINPTIDMYTAIIRGLIQRRNSQTLQRWLLRMPLLPGHFSPTLKQVHFVLEACPDFATFKHMRKLVVLMRKSGCRPSNETFRILIRARWKIAESQNKIPHLAAFSAIVADIKREGLSHDPSIGQLLYAGYADRGMEQYANQILDLYDSTITKLSSPEDTTRRLWHNKISDASRTKGTKAAIEVFRQLENEGCSASSDVIKSMIRYSRNLDDLKRVEHEFGMTAEHSHWSILINNNIRAGHLSNALSLYEESKKASLLPDAGLVGLLVSQLCKSLLTGPTDASLDQALSLYQDLANGVPATYHEQPKEDYTQHSIGPDVNIYQSLLRGLALSQNVRKYFPVAMSLFDDMKARGIVASDSSTASSLIVLYMRKSSRVSEALKIYQSLRSSLDEKGYVIVLNAFSKLTFGDDLHIPSLTHYFSIVRDMRNAGLPITVEVYTFILHQFGVLATKMNKPDVEYLPELHEKLVVMTRRTHDLLTLDAAVSPDAHVWNQLMDTYQRLGRFADSYRVWEIMYLSGRFDNISVSIILDACGYSGAYRVAKQICAKLFRDKFIFNLHNWNTWIECLCRLGRLHDAVEVACQVMDNTGNGVPADTESIRILVKFARKTNEVQDVLASVKHHLPDLWTGLPPDLKNI